MALLGINYASCGNLGLEQADAMVLQDQTLLHGLEQGDELSSVGIPVASDRPLSREQLVLELRAHDAHPHSLLHRQLEALDGVNHVPRGCLRLQELKRGAWPDDALLHGLVHGQPLLRGIHEDAGNAAEREQEEPAGLIFAAPLQELRVAELLIRGWIHIASHLAGLRQHVIRVLVDEAPLVGHLQGQMEAQVWVDDATSGYLGVQELEGLFARNEVFLHGLEDGNLLFAVWVSVTCHSPLCGQEPVMDFRPHQALPDGFIDGQHLVLYGVNHETDSLHIQELPEGFRALLQQVVDVLRDDLGLIEVLGCDAAPDIRQQVQACLRILDAPLLQLHVGEVLVRVGVEEALGVIGWVGEDPVHLLIEVAAFVGYFHGEAVAVHGVDDAAGGDLGLEQADAVLLDN
ncbi:hypothetical protein LUU34_01436300 [Aix galericulata]|nr:hypothetical protein LUU34_01436300 [Aix galericulata]